MKFTTGTQPDKDYEKGYEGHLSEPVKANCREFSEAYFKCNKGFGKKDADKASIKVKMQAIKDQLAAVEGNNRELLDYFEFLILIIRFAKKQTKCRHKKLKSVMIVILWD
ncbi:MAG: hypothetical protein RLZZ59_851 [Pseudomonadota bacterium]|jgi:hypothetical protein